MKKISFILLALLLLVVQQGVASEKRAEKIKPTRQTKLQKEAEKGDGMANAVLEALNPTPVNIVAVHEFLQNEGYAPEWRESGEVKYLTFKYQGQGIFVTVDEDYVRIYTGVGGITPFILNHTKQKSLSNRDLAHIYQTCIEFTQTFRVLKFRYDAEDDVAYMVVESFMPSMAIFKHYFDFYIGALKLAADEFEKSLNEKFGIK